MSVKIFLPSISEIRENFPVCKNFVYFDNAAVAPISLPVTHAIQEYLNHLTEYGGIHNYEEWDNKVEFVRQAYAHFLGAEKSEIAFIRNTSNGLSIIANGIQFKSGDNVVVPGIEYPSNVYVWMNLQRNGVETRLVENNNNRILLEDIEKLIDNHTRVVSISSVQFATGFKANLKAIGELVKEKSKNYGRKIYLVVDGIQSLGVVSTNVKDLGIDFLSADGHKWLLCPEGAGILYCNKDVINDIYPVIVGWRSVANPHNYMNIDFSLSQEAKKFEEGSLNLMGIFALGASLKLINKYTIDYIEKRVQMLTATLMNELENIGYNITSPKNDDERAGIVTFNKENADLKNVLNLLKQANIKLSLRGKNLRISPHFYNSEEEIDYFIKTLKDKSLNP